MPSEAVRNPLEKTACSGNCAERGIEPLLVQLAALKKAVDPQVFGDDRLRSSSRAG